MDRNQNENANQNWERQALEHLLLENLKETRKARRKESTTAMACAGSKDLKYVRRRPR